MRILGGKGILELYFTHMPVDLPVRVKPKVFLRRNVLKDIIRCGMSFPELFLLFPGSKLR